MSVHCGACGKKFDSAKELIAHLKVCLSANAGRKLMEDAFDAGLEPTAGAGAILKESEVAG